MKLRLYVALVFLVAFFTKARSQEENFIALSIYNFTRNIEWPAESKEGDFIIDIIGHKSVYDKLKELTAGRKIGTQNLTIRYLESTKNITKSHILFVGFWQSKELQSVVEKVSNSPTLIISEKDGLIENGSAINFVIRNSVIKFEIKKANIEKYKLKIGDALLNLAYKSY